MSVALLSNLDVFNLQIFLEVNDNYKEDIL